MMLLTQGASPALEAPMSLGLYIHIPFCKQKCHYCDFTSFPLRSPLVMDSYLHYLHKEISLRLSGPVDTVYIGGGTPSLCTPKQLEELLQQVARHSQLNATAEITIEVNPGTITLDDLRAYQAMGINRLSIGVQSLNDRFLKQLGRIHDAASVRRLIGQAGNLGLTNLSCDLIFGLPGQTMTQFKQELTALVGLQPQHISLYELTIEKHTALHARLLAGSLQPADEDLVADMLELSSDLLKNAGFEHYELSNYALPGFASQHNLKYWTGQNYMGVGLGAHSYLNNQRQWNVKKIQHYQNLLEAQYLPVEGGERLAFTRRIAERLMLGLRLTQGIDPLVMASSFGPEWATSWQEIFTAHTAAGLLESTGTKLRLTKRGRLLSDVVFRSFL